MLDIGWWEMMVVALVALVVIGPKDLPRVLRTAGRWAGKARAVARDFQRSLDEVARESELDEVKKQVEQAARYDPSRDFQETIDPTGDLRRAVDPGADVGGKSGASPGPESAPASPTPQVTTPEATTPGAATPQATTPEVTTPESTTPGAASEDTAEKPAAGSAAAAG